MVHSNNKHTLYLFSSRAMNWWVQFHCHFTECTLSLAFFHSRWTNQRISTLSTQNRHTRSFTVTETDIIAVRSCFQCEKLLTHTRQLLICDFTYLVHFHQFCFFIMHSTQFWQGVWISPNWKWRRDHKVIAMTKMEFRSRSLLAC